MDGDTHTGPTSRGDIKLGNNCSYRQNVRCLQLYLEGTRRSKSPIQSVARSPSLNSNPPAGTEGSMLLGEPV